MSVEDQIDQLFGLLETVSAELSSMRSDFDSGNFLIGMDFKIADLEKRLEKIESPDGNEMPDPFEPFYGSEDGLSFSGTAYLSGRKFTGLNSDGTKPWVKVDVAAGTVTEDAGPPSNPYPPSEEWYEKGNTVGDIHVTRL